MTTKQDIIEMELMEASLWLNKKSQNESVANVCKKLPILGATYVAAILR